MCQQAIEIQGKFKERFPIVSKSMHINDWIKQVDKSSYVYLGYQPLDIKNIISIGEWVHIYNPRPLEENWFDLRSSATWLPRQDQLQRIVIDECIAYGGYDSPTSWMLKYLMDDFNMFIQDFFHEQPSKPTYSHYSLELLWLLFTMDKAYDKHWSSEEQKWV
jgi:hypothetical protein